MPQGVLHPQVFQNSLSYMEEGVGSLDEQAHHAREINNSLSFMEEGVGSLGAGTPRKNENNKIILCPLWKKMWVH